MAKPIAKKAPQKKGFFLFRWFRNLWNYLKGCYRELKKVSWPTFQELMNHTWVILVMIGIFTLVIYGFDALFSFLTNLMYKIV